MKKLIFWVMTAVAILTQIVSINGCAGNRTNQDAIMPNPAAVSDIDISNIPQENFSVQDVKNLQDFLLMRPTTEDLSNRNYDLDENGIWNIFDLCLMKRRLLQTSESNKENEMKLNLEINGHLLTATLADNSSAKAFAELIKSEPLTIIMNDYANFEKVGKLPKNLPRNDEQIRTEAGDIILYQGNQVTIYYDENTWNFTRLGKIENITQAELKEILGTDSVSVTFSLAGKTGVFDMENKTVMLNSGYDMPILGLGTYSLTDETCVKSVISELQSGGRLIDTAYMYHNEASVGEGIRQSGVPREEIFVETKLYPNQYADAANAIDEALEKLDIDYIDLMLLHHPGTNDVEAYKAMEQAVADGKIRSIGLSNWYIEELEEFLPQISIIPALIQNEIHLNSGYDMPILGLGTYSLTDETCVKSVISELQSGGRLIDTAYMYHNEASVGEGIRQSGVPREEIFVETKLYPNQYADAANAIDEALEKLDIDYIDLMLLHHPGTNDVEAYKAMEQAVADGKIRSIGLSNWYIEELEEFLPQISIIPALIQNEIHPYYQEIDVVPYIQSLGIVMQGWYPLGGRGYTAELLGNEIIKKIAENHGVSSAQVILRWNLQRNVVVIPGSSNPDHIKENLDLFGFELSDDEMEQIKMLNRDEKHDWY